MGKLSGKLLRSWGFDEMFGSADTQKLDLMIYNGGELSRNEIPHKILPFFLESLDEFDDQIEKICVYRDGHVKSRTFHAFVVIQTREHYYSIERFPTGISVQQSTNLTVVTHHGGESRVGFSGFISRETDWMDGKGTVLDVLKFLANRKMFKKKYNVINQNCQTLCSLVFKNWNSEGGTFRKYRANTAGFELRRADRMEGLNAV